MPYDSRKVRATLCWKWNVEQSNSLETASSARSSVTSSSSSIDCATTIQQKLGGGMLLTIPICHQERGVIVIRSRFNIGTMIQ
jgi:hypothetical protein